MSYKDSSAYIQRIINQILYLHQSFFRVYIDNIMIYIKLKFLDEHLIHLNKIFILLIERKICIFIQKSFLNYLTV